MTAQNLEINKGDQFVVALDISASMQATDCTGGMSRTAYVNETTRTFITEASKYDPDGVSVYLFGAKLQEFRDATPDKIDGILKSYRHEGATMTHLAIDAAYAEHKSKKSEQTFLLLFTDGEPADQRAVVDSIVRITKDIANEKEFRIAFLTVGQRSSGLEAFLSDLDDNLTTKYGAKFDIVDVKKADEVDFMAAIDGALND